MSILDSLPHTCDAKKRTRASDGIGGSRDSYSTVFSGRSCWCQQAGDTEQELAAKRGIKFTNKLYFTSDPGLDETHAVIVYDKGGTEVGTFDVVSHPNIDASAGLGVLWRVMVNRSSAENIG